MSTDRAVGVIGQGRMGSHFRDQLLEADFETWAHDVDEDALAAAEAAGAVPADSPAALVDAVDVVAISVPGNPVVEAVMEAEDGVLGALEAGQTVIDVSTVSPDVDVEYAARCAKLDAGYLDAPVTWTGPTNGVSMFVGGDGDTYEANREVIEALSGNHEHYGEVGSGQVAKAGQRIEQMFDKVLHTEVVEFLEDGGVDARTLSEQLGWGLGDGYFKQPAPEADGLEAAAESAGEHEQGVAIEDRGARRTLKKSRDIHYALDVAHANNTAVPLLSTAFEVLKANRRYRRVLRAQDADHDWGERTGTSYWRRLNRPSERWLALLEE